MLTPPLIPSASRGVRIRNSAGFSLTELLVVVGIVGTLAAMTFPMVSKMQKSAKVTQTSSRLKDVGSAVALYAAENDGNIPILCKNGFKAPYWTQEISPYLAPAIPGGGVPGQTYSLSPSLVSPLLSAKQHHAMSDFGGNPEVFLRSWDKYGAAMPRRLGSISNPSRVAMAVTAAETTNPLKATWYIESWEYVRGNKGLLPHDQGSGKIITLFCDGHVSAIPVDEFDKNKKELLLVDINRHPPPIDTER